MKKISMKFMSGFISMIMMINLIAPVGVYASVETGDETVIEETAGEETITQEEDLEEQLTTASGAETVKEEEETKEEETVSESGEEEKVSKPFNESKTIGDVTITVKAEAGAFPDGSYLTVKEIASNTDMSSDDETLAASYSYDITIYDKDDNEIEPAEGKNVSVSFSMERIADSNLDTNIYHTSDDGTVTELDITTSGDTATATTDSFSVYTVEFTYGELTYVMNGDSSIKLSDILNSVSLTGEATNVECSDTSLFSASNKTGEWIISSHKAFSTTEWMKVTIEDIVYEIKVTDAQTGTCGTNVTWTLDGGTLTISGTGDMANYTYTTPWYFQRASITTVVISDGVTSIGDCAFIDCTDLRSITIPSGVTSIGESAFMWCSSLSSITIPSSVTSIGDYAFDGCSSLSSITIPSGVTSIGNDTFNGCTGLTGMIIPDGVTVIAECAFNGCSSLRSITIPDSVTSIGTYAFEGCINLSSITIPSSVTSIGLDAFYNIASTTVIYYEGTEDEFKNITNNSLPSATIKYKSTGGNCGANGDNVKWSYYDNGTLIISGTGAMKDYAVKQEEPWRDKINDITNITISDGVTNIGDNAFNDFSKLSSITIPNSVTNIGESAFGGCSNLASITIPDSVTSIGDWAFYNCSSLSSITIPASVMSIGEGVFAYCSSLTSITYSGNIISMGRRAYLGCSSLSSITLQDGITSIWDNAFNGCRSLTSITIPNSVTSIGDAAFKDCSGLTSINIPTSVTSIGDAAFQDCRGLTSITIPSGVTSINDHIFQDCSGLTSITLPNSITSIGEGAFSYCSGLSSITIPSSVTSIAEFAFAYCNGLTSITIPGNVTSIGESAFTCCVNLNSITIPVSVKRIDAYAFSGIPDDAVIYYEGNDVQFNAIEGKENIPKANLKYKIAYGDCGANGNNVKWTLWDNGKLEITGTGKMKDYSDVTPALSAPWYSNNGKITSVTISDGVTSIGDNAFRDCGNLSSVTIPASVTSIGDNVFTGVGTNTSGVTINYDGTKDKLKTLGDNIGIGSNAVVQYNPINITIKANAQTVALGGAISSTTSDVTVTGSLASGHSLEGITLDADTSNATTNGKITPKDAVIKNGTNVVEIEGNYNITYVSGTLTVNKKPLTITADSDSKTYDGTALTKNSYTNTALATGDNITSVTITGSQTVFGTSNNVPSAAVIKNAAGDDVTSNYDITYTNGTLNVTKRDVTVTVSDKTVSYNNAEQTGNTSYSFANVAAGDTATITYTPAKGTDASATAYDNGSFADDFKVMSGSTDVTSSYNLKTKTVGKLTINRAAITPKVTIRGWFIGQTADTPRVTGNVGNGTVTIEYKKSTEADAAYTGTVPTAEGTYTVRATIDETANSFGATATAEFKISTKPVVIDNDESDKKSSDDNNDDTTPPDTGYETFMKDLNAAAKKGTPQTLVLNWGNSLSYETMQILKDNPQLTLIFNFKWQGVDYSTTIGGGRTVYVDKNTPWYGPECLIGRYGATRGRVYVAGNTASNQGNGVYVVQKGDSLWKIANRKLHVSVDYLVRRNNIVNRNRIRTGQVIYY